MNGIYSPTKTFIRNTQSVLRRNSADVEEFENEIGKGTGYFTNLQTSGATIPLKDALTIADAINKKMDDSVDILALLDEDYERNYHIHQLEAEKEYLQMQIDDIDRVIALILDEND